MSRLLGPLTITLLSGGLLGAVRVQPPGNPILSADSVPGLDVSVTEVRYPVRASTLRGVMDRMDATSLEGLPPGTAHGLTDYRFEPSWSLAAGDSRCAFASVTAALEVSVHLPEWDGYDDAADWERQRWDEYLEALTTHEHAHRDITVEGVSELMGELQDMEGWSCNALQTRATALIHRRMGEVQERHEALDAAFR